MRSAFAMRSSSRLSTGFPSKCRMPAMALIARAIKPYLPLRRIDACFSRSSSSAYADDPVSTECPICHGDA